MEDRIRRLREYAESTPLNRIEPGDDALGIVNQVAPKSPPFVEFVDRFVDAMNDRQPGVMRALKAQAAEGQYVDFVGSFYSWTYATGFAAIALQRHPPAAARNRSARAGAAPTP